jgi:hypothetical protein
MPAAILVNKKTSTLPPLAFVTPAPSPGFMRLRRRERIANEPPLLLKRKCTPSSSHDSASASYLPTNANLPFLECENFCKGSVEKREESTSYLPLPDITLNPRTKRSTIGCFLSSSPQEEYVQQRSEYEPETRRRRVNSLMSEDANKNTDAALSTTLHRTSSSKSMLSRSSSVSLTRSLSLQLNISFQSLAAAATNSNDGCPLSATTSSIMPQRKSLLNLPSSSTSSQDIQTLDVNQIKEQQRRSPVAATLDYIATAIRFPDVGIGLSI